jgi:hypothetical protein
MLFSFPPIFFGVGFCLKIAALLFRPVFSADKWAAMQKL